jgi:hypothetical protein
MTPAQTQLGPWMRLVLVICGPMNVAGAITFAPPVTAGREALGVPEAPPFYLWLIASWILAFGIAYFHQGWTGQASRGVLAVGSAGKAAFAALLIGGSVAGDLPATAIGGALPDLVLAMVFGGWLWRTMATGCPSDLKPALAACKS